MKHWKIFIFGEIGSSVRYGNFHVLAVDHDAAMEIAKNIVIKLPGLIIVNSIIAIEAH